MNSLSQVSAKLGHFASPQFLKPRPTRTSKQMLNLNAIKFKLIKLRSITIRYEVIYKNLLKDLRKYYAQEFNFQTDYSKKKTKNNFFYKKAVKVFVTQRFPVETLARLGIEFDELCFYLGSLIYP
jgi:hypothetical protein